jgi:thiol-disulfide isomerase/thioredoxin
LKALGWLLPILVVALFIITGRHPDDPSVSSAILAPETSGIDAAGEPIRLQDFRGRVVVLSFWGLWCPHCRDMFPHERALVHRLAGRPFTLLGVNSDDDRQAVLEAQKRLPLPWQSLWDGGSPHGPIAQAWHVNGWPSVFVIDHKGRVRYREVRGSDLDRAVDRLMKECETDLGLAQKQ